LENEITDITRRAIIDQLTSARVAWADRLEEPDFLSRLYNLAELPSTDRRVRDAYADIYMHRVTWHDWEDDWVFYDTRFNLLQGPDREFLRFLCETVHPAVRPDASAARGLVAAYNRELAADGYTLVEVKQISGRPVFAPQKSDQRVEVFEEPTGWQKVDRQLQEVRLRLDTADTEEQYQAVGLLCREVLISLAQDVFDPLIHQCEDGVTPSETDAKRMLDSVLAHELPGAPNEEARAHAKAAVRLALALQHKRTADFRMAALCAEATSSTVNIMAVLAGRRSRAL
jgi:AbiJ N-terminal domain 3